MWNSFGVVLIVCLTVGWVLRKLAEQLAARDATMAKLEERVQVLERIVIRRSYLDEEFDRLRA